MNFQLDMQLHLGFGLLLLCALLAVRHAALRRFDVWAHGLTALVGLAAFFNFGSLHHYTDVGFVNRWEIFHYHLGSKYFAELGYDGLYAASLQAQRQSAQDKPLGSAMRDLRDNELQPLAASGDHVRELRSRFSTERWRDFVVDHAIYTGNTPRNMWKMIRTDHGYNATPFWTGTAQPFSAALPPHYGSLVFLALLDVVLLIASMAFLFSTFGYHAGCLALAITGLGFGWHYNYIGAFLRLDWWAASLTGLCLLERKRFALAGACFAFAAFWRIFPILLLVGPALHALKQLREGQRPRWAMELAAGFAIASVLALAVGSAAGRGPQAWFEFADRIAVHSETASSNSVGLSYVIANDPATLMGRAVDPERAASLTQLISERALAKTCAAALLLGLTLVAMWRVSLLDSAILGLLFIFSLTDPSSYYWVLLAAVPLTKARAPSLEILALWCVLFAVELGFGGAKYLSLHFGLMSWGLLGIFIVWLTSILVVERPGSGLNVSEIPIA